MNRLIQPVVLLLLLLPVATRSQSRYHFSTLSMEQGLSANSIWSICQDKYGFMWFGTTGGLNRYDGHSIRTYLHDPKDSFSIPGNVVYWIHRDNLGDMWFACGYGGVVRYNYAKDRFEKFEGYESMKKQVGHAAPVWRVGEDQRKRIYINCGGACFRYTPGSGKMEDLTPLFKGKIDWVGVSMDIPQGPDSLWIVTDNGLFLHLLEANTLEYIEFDNKELGVGHPGFSDGSFINEEEMILTTPRSGFVFFNTKTKEFRPAPAPYNPSVSKIHTGSGNIITDSRGRAWIANSVFGLIEYTKARQPVSIKADPGYPYRHPEQEGHGKILYEDRDGNIWYGTSQQGLIWFQPRLDFIQGYQRDYADPASLGSDVVCHFFPSKDGNLFVGTGKGLSKLNLATNHFINYPKSVSVDGIYPGSVARSFARSGDTLAIATDGGLSFYNESKNVFWRYVAGDGSKPFELFSNYVYQAHLISPGILMLVSNEGRVARFDMKTGRCYTTAYPDGDDTLYSLSGVEAVAYDRARKKFWLETDKGSLFEYDPLTRKGRHHQYSTDTVIMQIGEIAIDSTGNLWLGTNNGLVAYDPVSGKSRQFSLPTASQNILNVSCRGGLVWITTNNEIVKVEAATGASMTFNLYAFVPNIITFARSMYVDQNNTLWIGGNKGIYRIDGNKFHQQTDTKLPSLVNFRVFDQQKLFDQPYHELQKIELNNDENFFSFNFSSLDYNQAAGIRYKYRLEPFDVDWKISDKNSASYTNVPPGTYTLRLRTEYGLDKYKEAKPITVHISAPWWRQTWFIALVIAAMVAIGWFLYRLRLRRKAQQRIDETIDYFANSLYGENSVTEICWDIARNCIAQMKLEDCVVYLVDEKRNVLSQKAAFGPKNPKEHEIINPIEIPMGKGIVGATAASGKFTLVKDTSKDDRYIVDEGQRYSELAVPIIHEGKVIGVIDSEHSRKNFFTESHVKLLSTIAAISANKIAEARADEVARESKMQLLEIKKLLAESQLMALRAQMNPHFVFNCLNSIQECIVTQKYGEASLYLNKFAKLFRSVLNNSGKGMVTLAEETEVLELYLALEHMRFEKSFTYSIDMDEDLESDEMVIPSMLLQPYVENALWHGLMHKQGERKLCISFRRKSNSMFECVIEDNGIGRKKAMELKEQQNKSKRHTSRGMAISQDRLDLLQKQGQHAVLEIVDKYNDAGEATGTKVVIELSSFLQ
jgi:ligand-binding sensor domain-containing protein/putative methionine-R-sulfoxide reductase with GAF domain